MDRIVYIFSAWALLIAVNEAKAFQTYGFRQGDAIVESVCAYNYRVFNRVGVPSSISCASVCTKTTGCDAVYFSAVNGTCTGCRKTLADASPTSTLNEYYKLVNDKILEWSNGTSRYLLDINIKMTYADAKVYCQQFGAHVVVPDSQDEQDSLAGRLSMTPTVVLASWIGITDIHNTNTFLVEHSGEMVNYTSWAQGEPNDTGGNEPCNVIAHRMKWYDVPCSHLWNVVCQRD